jgi:hypothetical protein
MRFARTLNAEQEFTMPKKTANPQPDEAFDVFVPQAVILKKSHTHAGKQYQAGDEIIVSDAVTLRFLVARGIV